MQTCCARIGSIVIAGLVVIATLGGATGSSVDNGKRVYMAVGCVQCHGTVGQGGPAGPKIAPDPIPYDALLRFVRTTARSMPPYRETVLSNTDLADIYAYLQSIPKSLHPKDIPLLNQQ